MQTKTQPGATAGPLLAASELQGYYGKSHVLQNAGISVHRDEIVVVAGRNGMGKTTLLRALINMPPLQRTGTVRFASTDISHAPVHNIAALGVGYVPQGRSLFPSLSVEEHLQLAQRRTPGTEERAIWRRDDVYDLFPELAERRRISGTRLSGGEQQMLAIGRSLVTGPQLLLMDEPSEGLAQKVIHRLQDVFRQLNRDGIAILLVEQNLGLAQTLADRVYVMLNGEVAHEASGEAFRAAPDNEVGQYLRV